MLPCKANLHHFDQSILNFTKKMLSIRPAYFGLAVCLLLWAACQSPSDSTSPANPNQTSATPHNSVQVPQFSADTAYRFVEKQVAFGARVPGSPAHQQCANWLAATLRRFADTVYVQQATVTNYAGKRLPMYNIIGSFRPDAKDRIMLCSHWDSRPRADQDSSRQTEPILGADDGGSSTAVLLEVARLLHQYPAQVGIDLILFDVEDDGVEDKENSFCLGSQYWGKNPHLSHYTARYGVLLDMVGSADAIFPKEQHSLAANPQLVDKVWGIAAELGYSSLFPTDTDMSPSITDDHVYVTQLAHIPTIDIINYVPYRGFGRHWHTHRDNMNIISRNTLGAVGQTVATLVYREGVAQ